MRSSHSNKSTGYSYNIHDFELNRTVVSELRHFVCHRKQLSVFESKKGNELPYETFVANAPAVETETASHQAVPSDCDEGAILWIEGQLL